MIAFAKASSKLDRPRIPGLVPVVALWAAHDPDSVHAVRRRRSLRHRSGPAAPPWTPAPSPAWKPLTPLPKALVELL